MMTTAMKMTIRIGRNDVGVDLSFISQNYTIMQCSPKQKTTNYEKGVIKRRELVVLLLQFFTEKVLGAGENGKAEDEY